MKLNKIFRYIIIPVLAAAALVDAGAQSVSINARFDSTAMMIGDQIKLRIEVERQKNVRVQFPAWKDTLTRNIEIMEIHPVDSLQTGEMMNITQDITVTSFDSGRHVLPPIRFPIEIDGIADTIATRSLYLDVYTMPLDSTKNIADIKPVYQIPIGWIDVYPWILKIGALLLLSAVIGFIIYAIVRRRNNRPIFGSIKPVDPPHVIALRELDKLRGDKLWQRNRAKEYYTRLSDITRTYIESRFGISAMEMTSDEILIGLRRIGFEDNNLVDRLRKMFSLADLVKFAKADPLPDENETSMLDSYLFVNNTKIEMTVNAEESAKADIAEPGGATQSGSLSPSIQGNATTDTPTEMPDDSQKSKIEN